MNYEVQAIIANQIRQYISPSEAGALEVAARCVEELERRELLKNNS